MRGFEGSIVGGTPNTVTLGPDADAVGELVAAFVSDAIVGELTFTSDVDVSP